MKVLKNKILNDIFQRFVKKNNIKKEKITFLDKLISFIPIVRLFKYKKLIDNLKEFENQDEDIDLLKNLCFREGILFSLMLTVFGIIDNALIVNPNFSYTTALASITFTTFTIFVCNIIFSKFQLYMIKENKDIIYKGELNVPLSKEDFKLLLNNINKELIFSIMKENDDEYIGYIDLEELDDLIASEELTLNEIRDQDAQEIIDNIDTAKLINNFKGKSMKETLKILESVGVVLHEEEKQNILNREKYYKDMSDINNQDINEDIKLDVILNKKEEVLS